MSSSESERRAFEVTDAFLAGFNARDRRAHFDSFNFPHVRIASGQVRVWQTREELDANHESYGTREVEPGWSESRWDHRKVIHAGLAETTSTSSCQARVSRACPTASATDAGTKGLVK